MTREDYFSVICIQKNLFLSENFIGKDSSVILQTRNILDTIVSLKDFMDQRSPLFLNPFFVSWEKIWGHLSDDEKINQIIFYYLPWHLDWLLSWKDYDKALRIDYENIVNDTNDSVTKICEYIKINKSNRDIENAINVVNSKPNKFNRINVGLSGRYKTILSEYQIDNVKNAVKLTKDYDLMEYL